MVRVAEVVPLASGFWRLALAAPLLLLLAPMTGQALPRLDRRLVAIIWIAGAAFALDLAFWHEGILRTRLANSTLVGNATRSEEHTSELQSLMRISYAVFCLKKKTDLHEPFNTTPHTR